MIRYNPNDENYKFPKGAVRQGETIKFNIEVSRETFVTKVDFVLSYDGEYAVKYKMDWTGLRCGHDIFSIEIKLDRIGLCWYYFEVAFTNNVLRVGKNFLNKAEICENEVTEFQLTIFDKNLKTPDWFKKGLMYQIFVDRFYKSQDTFIREDIIFHENWNDEPNYKSVDGKILNNDFFGGNLFGVIEKLDYLKSLGVNIIYLNPVFEAASNHKYDTGNYMSVDKMFGGDEALFNLISECKKRKIKIILDGVFNHTGDDSIYFNKYGRYKELGAYQSKDSKYRDWFNFIDYPRLYHSWWGIETLPETNKNNEEFTGFITGKDGVIDYWIKKGIAGFRLDVVDELPDFFVEKIREAIKKADKNSILIGEVWEDASNKISYHMRRKYFLGFELDGVMNYPLKKAIIEFTKNGNNQFLSSTLNVLVDHYPKDVLDCCMNILGTHDTVRIITALATNQNLLTKDEKARFYLEEKEYDNGKKMLKIASLLKFTLPGVPCIYYGDEIETEGYEDPFNRKTFKWHKLGCEINLWYKGLGALRKNKVFFGGGYSEVYSEDGIFIFKRFNQNKEVYIGVNCGKSQIELEISVAKVLLTNAEKVEAFYYLKPMEYIVFEKKADK